MLKVPATPAGFPVIEELLACGINVNVTLIFSLKQYENTANAFIKGLERLSQTQSDLSQIASVASVFGSRIDNTVVELLIKKIQTVVQKERLPKFQMANSLNPGLPKYTYQLVLGRIDFGSCLFL